MKNYRVWLKSVPGMFTQYDGKVDVKAQDEDTAVKNALRKLRTGVFSDRTDRMWKIQKVERIY